MNISNSDASWWKYQKGQTAVRDCSVQNPHKGCINVYCIFTVISKFSSKQKRLTSE